MVEDRGWRLPTLVYDGDCAFCTTSARWVERRWDDRDAVAVSSRSVGERFLDETGASRDELVTAVWWFEPGRPSARGAQGIAGALRFGRGWSHLVGVVLGWPIVRELADLAYPVIARNRHRLPGATDACRLDDPPEG